MMKNTTNFEKPSINNFQKQATTNTGITNWLHTLTQKSNRRHYHLSQTTKANIKLRAGDKTNGGNKI